MDLVFASYRGTYGFTFVIPSTKKVLYQSGRKNKNYLRNYGYLKQHEQRAFLDRILSDISLNVRCKWVYEEHEDKRLHVHGIIYDEHEEYVMQYRNKFYEQVGYKSPKCYLKYSDIRELNNISAWEDYMNKQHIKSKYEQEQKEFKDFDYGIVQISTRLDEYYNSLTSHLESEMLDDTYKFGTKNKKYIVEL